MRRVYIETSVWGMIHPDQNPALRLPTVEFLDHCERGIHQPHISDVVVREIRQATTEKQDRAFQAIARLDPLFLMATAEAEALAQRFVAAGVLTAGRLDDARHVACAIVHELDIVVSWNYRHIANVRKADRFRAVAVLEGHRGTLEIHTPLEIVEWT